MAAGEEQAQTFVGHAFVGLRGGQFGVAELLVRLQRCGLVCAHALMAQAIDDASPGHHREPGCRAPRHAVARPALERCRNRVLERILGEVEVAEAGDERGQHEAGLPSHDLVERLSARR